ncbi:unnamed protein product [Brassica rapa subsp. trilocularis]
MKKIWNCKELPKEIEEEKETSNRRERVTKKFQAVQIKRIMQIKQNKCRSSGSCRRDADHAGEIYIKRMMRERYISNKKYFVKTIGHNDFREDDIGEDKTETLYAFKRHLTTSCLLQVLSIDAVIGAISAGNTVVLKASELAPASSSLLAKLLEQYLDPCAVRVVEGAVTETTLLLEQKWNKIFYTGSSRIGRIIMTAAVKHLTPVSLELGGKSLVVIDSDTNLDITVRRIISGKWGCNNGQVCISPDYILTTKEYAPKVIDALKQELEAFYGNKSRESKDMSRIVNLNQFDRLSKMLEEKEVSDKIIYGGQKNRDNLLKESFTKTVSAGSIVVNDTAVHFTLPTLPFGGVGESGIGSCSFDAFSHKKSVLFKSFLGDSVIRYPPYSRKMLRLLKALVNSNLVDTFKVLLDLS